MYLGRGYIRARLEKQVYSAGDGLNTAYFLRSQMSVIQSPADTLAYGKGGVKGKIYRFIYKHKEFFRSLPIIGSYMVKRKRQMLSESYGSLHIAPIIHDDFLSFIEKIYQIALGRNVEPEALLSYMERYRRCPFSNEVVAYEVLTSVEFNNRYTIQSMDVYQKAHKKYMRKWRLYHTPLIGKAIRLLTFRSRYKTNLGLIKLYEGYIAKLLKEMDKK